MTETATSGRRPGTAGSPPDATGRNRAAGEPA